MTQGTLVFFSNSERSLATLDQTIVALKQIGLLGAPADPSEYLFLAGPRFLQLISFLGCSPHIPLTPEQGDDFCQIELTGPLHSSVLKVGNNTRPPRCPLCRAKITDWEILLKTSGAQLQGSISCPDCKKSILPCNLLWRQLAGLGRNFISIKGIYPGEAVPVDELMSCLGRIADHWSYCYLTAPRTFG